MISIVPLIYLCSLEVYFQSLKSMVVKRNFYVPFIQASFISCFVHLFSIPFSNRVGCRGGGVYTACHLKTSFFFCFPADTISTFFRRRQEAD